LFLFFVFLLEKFFATGVGAYLGLGLVLQEARNLGTAASGHLTVDNVMLFLSWWFFCLHSPDMTPCMSPLPHDSPLIEKPGLGQIQEESEGAGFKAFPGKGLNICKVFASSLSIPHPVFIPTPY
jgi:hypothetical protein